MWLFAVGVGDVVAGLSGRPVPGARSVLGVFAAVLVAAILGPAVGWSIGPVALFTAITVVAVALWVWARLAPLTPRRATAIAWGFALVLAAVVASGRAWPAPAGALQDWLARSSVPSIADAGIDRALVMAGVFAFLMATSNAVVRLILAAVGTDTESGEQKLRGGRMIGPLERALLFGFGLAGQPTAAALVASAKSLLRFPEISSARGMGIDLVTEYFLVGSLASWALALAPLVFVPR
jgi:hypothetical protein